MLGVIFVKEFLFEFELKKMTDKALGLLKKYTQSNIANLYVDELKPSSDLQTVIEMLSETKDAIAIVQAMKQASS